MAVTVQITTKGIDLIIVGTRHIITIIPTIMDMDQFSNSNIRQVQRPLVGTTPLTTTTTTILHLLTCSLPAHQITTPRCTTWPSFLLLSMVTVWHQNGAHLQPILLCMVIIMVFNLQLRVTSTIGLARATSQLSKHKRTLLEGLLSSKHSR